jgi:hypothetical protein
MKTGRIVLIAATILSGSAGLAWAGDKGAHGMAQWCTNDQAMATKDKVYDPNCPGTEVKRNADGTWGSAPSTMGTPGGADMNSNTPKEGTGTKPPTGATGTRGTSN